MAGCILPNAACEVVPIADVRSAPGRRQLIWNFGGRVMKRGCLVATVALWTSLLVTESLAVLLAPEYSGYLEINNEPQQQALEVWSDGTNRSVSLSGTTASISNDYN